MRRLWWKVARSSPGTSVLIVVIVLASAAALTAWPMLLRDLTERSLRDAAEKTPAVTRALRAEASLATVGGATDDLVWADVDDALQAYTLSWQPALADLTDAGQVLVGSAPFSFDGPTATPEGLSGRLLNLRAIRTLDQHVDYVDGAAPGPAGEVGTPVPAAVSAQTAEELGITTGDVVDLAAATWTGSATELEITGVFDPADGSEQYFDQQIGALAPSYLDDPNLGVFGTGAAYVHPDSISRFDELVEPGTTMSVWFPVGTDVVDGDALQVALRDATARPVVVEGPWESVDLAFTTALSERLAAVTRQSIATNATLALVASGPIGLMFAIVGGVARLATLRRGMTLSLMKARGGASGRIRLMLGLEGLVLGLVPAAVGFAIAALVTPGGVSATDALLPAALGLAPAAALAGAPLPSLRAQRADVLDKAAARRRGALEIAAIALAAAAVYLALAGGVGSGRTSPDLLVSATPLLLAIALAIVFSRLLGRPLAAVHALLRRRRTLPAFLGSARASRERNGGLVSTLALVVGVSIAVFATTMITTIDRGLREDAASRIGADLVVAGAYYSPEEIDGVAGIEGVAAVSSSREFPATAFYVDGRFQRLSLYAVDTGTFAQVQRGVPGALAIPDGMDELDGGALPMILSDSYGEVDGTELAVNVEGQHPVTIVGRGAQAPGIVAYPDQPWAVVDAGLLRQVSERPLPARQVLVALHDDADVDAVTGAVVDALGGRGGLSSTDDVIRDVADTPLAAALPQGFAVALVVTAVQSVLAIALTLIVAAPSRRRLFGVLRTLGARPQQTRALIRWEVGPLAVVAVVAGTLLGLALPHLMVAAVDLTGFTAGRQPVVSYDGGRIGLVVLATVVVVALIAGVAGAIARRSSITELRVGEAS